MSFASTIDLIAALTATKGCRFASLTYTSKEANETARYNVLLGFDYMASVRASLEELSAKRANLSGIDAIAADELLTSFQKTLDGTQDRYTKAATYEATTVPGLKVNTVDNSLQLFGLVQTKVVIVPGVYPVVNSAPKTIAKYALRKELPIGKFREFALDSGVIHSARINGETIEF